MQIKVFSVASSVVCKVAVKAGIHLIGYNISVTGVIHELTMEGKAIQAKTCIKVMKNLRDANCRVIEVNRIKITTGILRYFSNFSKNQKAILLTRNEFRIVSTLMTKFISDIPYIIGGKNEYISPSMLLIPAIYLWPFSESYFWTNSNSGKASDAFSHTSQGSICLSRFFHIYSPNQYFFNKS